MVGDLRSAAETRSIADQVNAIGRMDAVIHNAGVYTERSRGSTPEGHAGILAVNTLAPYMLTALIERPDRLVYLSSGLHRGGEGSLRRPRLDEAALGSGQGLRRKQAAGRRARLRAGAALAGGLEQRRRSRLGAHQDGRPRRPVDLDTGQRTQTWLAVSDEPAALVSGRYWHHLRQQQPAAKPRIQNSRTSSSPS